MVVNVTNSISDRLNAYIHIIYLYCQVNRAEFIFAMRLLLMLVCFACSTSCSVVNYWWF